MPARESMINSSLCICDAGMVRTDCTEIIVSILKSEGWMNGSSRDYERARLSEVG